MTQRLDTDLIIGPTPCSLSSHFFSGDYPRKEIKALSTIKLKSLRNGLKLILEDLCWWSTMTISVLCFKKRFKVNVSSGCKIYDQSHAYLHLWAVTVSGPLDFGV